MLESHASAYHVLQHVEHAMLPDEIVAFQARLNDIMGPRSDKVTNRFWHVSAAHKSKAFPLTCGKWREEK